MTEMSQYPPGTFSWQDLSTTDPEAAKRFYSGLFGWEIFDIPMGPGMFYTMLRLEGKDVAGLSSQTQEMRDQGVPPFWTSYVSVASADEAASKVKALGGQVLAEPFDVFEEGRMAVFQDPTGAVFAAWQPKNHIGTRLVNQPGTLCWNELATTDASKAKAFYTGLFGWDTEEMDMGSEGLYTLFLNAGRQNGGMMQMGEEWGNVPSHWMVYFAVADCDRSVQKATELGAQVMIPPAEAGDIGRFAMLRDPQGAAFAIIKLYNPN